MNAGGMFTSLAFIDERVLPFLPIGFAPYFLRPTFVV